MQLFALLAQVQVQFYCYLTSLWVSKSVSKLDSSKYHDKFSSVPRKVAREAYQRHSIPQKS